MIMGSSPHVLGLFDISSPPFLADPDSGKSRPVSVCFTIHDFLLDLLLQGHPDMKGTPGIDMSTIRLPAVLHLR